MTVGFDTFGSSSSTIFVIQNISNKAIKIFGKKINPRDSYNLLKLNYVSEIDIRNSLLKGSLKSKISVGELVVLESNIDLTQYDDEQKLFLQNSGVSNGLSPLPQPSLTNVYVDSVNGNDNNSGSFGSPFATLNKACESLDKNTSCTINIIPGSIVNGNALLKVMIDRTASLLIQCEDWNEIIPAFALSGTSTNINLVPLINQNWEIDGQTEYFIEVISSSNSLIVGDIKAIAKNTATALSPISALSDITVPDDTMIRIVRPNMVTIEFDTGAALFGGAPGTSQNTPAIAFKRVKINMPENGLEITGSVCAWESEIHSDTPYTALSATVGTFSFGSSYDYMSVNFGYIFPKASTGVQFTGPSYNVRPYIYVGFANVFNASVICGYMNLTSVFSSGLESGRFFEGIDIFDCQVVYPGTWYTTPQTTWVTGAGFGASTFYNSVVSWQGPYQQLTSTEDMIAGNRCFWKNSSQVLITTGGKIRLEGGSLMRINNAGWIHPTQGYVVGEAGISTSQSTVAPGAAFASVIDGSRFFRIN